MSEHKPVPNLMKSLRESLEKAVQPPATPQEPESPYKPCPFCGGQAEKIAVDEASNMGGYVVTCCSCDASSAVVFPVKDSPDGLLNVLWNRRASTPSPEGQTWHEEWRGVVGYEGRYEVSCFGRVRKLGGPIVGQWRKSAGYYQVRLSEPRAVHLVHRLVAKAFIPNHENKPGVNHIDFDTINNAVANLEWCTQAENIQHSAKAGRMNRPEMRGKRPTVAAFTDEQVAAMRQQYATGGETWSSLAAKFGVSKRTVGRILRREVYSYV